MKKYILQFVFLFAVVVCLPSMGLALNSGAHIYVTEQIFGSSDVDILYGSIAPDIADYVPNPEMWENSFDDTHHKYIILWPQGWTVPWKRFAIGWMVHNEVWGEDWYSHIEYLPTDPPLPPVVGGGYVIDKASQLLPILAGVDATYEQKMLMAHIAVEFAIDILVQQYNDPTLGQKLGYVAMNRSDQDIQRLFNVLTAKNKAVDKQTLYDAEDNFRTLIIGYSNALYNSDLSTKGLSEIAGFGSYMATNLLGVTIDPVNVEGILWYTVGICISDYNDFLEDIIDGIQDDLED
jgi:hypothetical protein